MDRPTSGHTSPYSLAVIVGPTGVGKTEIAVRLAKRLNAEILSCDAYQVYKGLPIGTNQPPQELLREVPHHLVGVREPSETWSAADFAQEASAILQKAEETGRRILVVGGSGFYLQALLEGVPPGSAPTPEERGFVLAEMERMGLSTSHEWLKEKDPAAAARIHPNDKKRISRALEKALFPAPPVQGEPSVKREAVVIGLERSRENLDEALRARTRAMWSGGLLEETRRLMDAGIPRGKNVWGAIGYEEAADHLEGRLKAEEAVEKIFRRTRQYAKRQWTWFKGHHGTRWINLDGFKDAEDAVESIQNRFSGN
jgi:tRNA dimethylallyltransferase